MLSIAYAMGVQPEAGAQANPVMSFLPIMSR